MKKILLLSLMLFGVFSYSQNREYIDASFRFEVGQTPYTFGNNVRLRSAPNVNSKIILKIPIAERLTILEKTKTKTLYNGIASNWYKVTYKSQVGYVLGGLLTLLKKKIQGDVYLNSLMKEETKGDYYIITRLVTKNNILEHINKVDYRGIFGAKVYNNRGVLNIQHMIYVDYYSESCGEEGGGYYLFYDGKRLKKAIQLYQAGDVGGGFYEYLIFPKDDEDRNSLYYKCTKGSSLDDNYEQSLFIEFEAKVKWEGKEIKVKLPKKFKEFKVD